MFNFSSHTKLDLKTASSGTITTAMRALLFHNHTSTSDLLCVIDEFSYNNGIADVVFVKTNRFIVEVEIKSSLSDLKHEVFKRCRNPNLKEQGYWRNGFTLNYFVFCITEPMVKSGRPFIEQHFPHAGILVFDGSPYLKLEKKMKRIHNGKASDNMLIMLLRAQSRKYVWKMAKELGNLGFYRKPRNY